MNRHVTRGVAGTRALVRAWRSEQLTFIAASLAYYAFVSLFPLLLLVIVAASVFGGQELADSLAAAATTTVAPVAGKLVEGTLSGADIRGGATLVGVAVLVWSGLKVFRGLDIAFSMVYGGEASESFTRQVRDALTALFAVGAGVAAVVVAGTVVATTGVEFVGVLATPALIVGLVVALLPLYYLFPDTDVSLQEALPGAVLAAVGWTLLGTAFRLYAENAGGFQGYGIVGAVLLLLTWFYIGSIVLLSSATVNAVLAGRLAEDDIATEFPERQPLADCRKAHGTSRDDDGDTTRTSRDGGGERPGAATGGSGGSGGRSGRDAGGDADAVDRSESEDKPPAVDQGQTAPTGQAGQAGQAGQTAQTGQAGEAGEVRNLREQIRDLRGELREFEDDVEDRTVHRDELEEDLRRYVRRRIRRGHARGWGPYLVLLYGTAMTLGAFYYLGSGWAVLAMVVVWLSTLGLYALMLVVGAILGIAGLPGRLGEFLGRFRSRR